MVGTNLNSNGTRLGSEEDDSKTETRSRPSPKKMASTGQSTKAVTGVFHGELRSAERSLDLAMETEQMTGAVRRRNIMGAKGKLTYCNTCRY